jgi:hypothetical protein
MELLRRLARAVTAPAACPKSRSCDEARLRLAVQPFIERQGVVWVVSILNLTLPDPVPRKKRLVFRNAA